MQDIEIIIVDKGEQDEARDIIDHYVTRDQRIRAPHIPNNGYGASCNIGLALARSPYVLIVESDDYILPDMCESLYSTAEKYRADIVKTPYIAFMEGGVLDDCPYRQKMAMLLPKNRCFSAKEYGEILEIHASVWSCLYRRSYLEERKTSEIAVLLNISTRTVEVQLYKALKILRGILLSCLIFLSNF